jgi:pyridoxamine 5'-phosphate oxidase
VRSPAAESDAYFATRPWRSQLNALSSEQSRPLADPAALEQRAAQLAASGARTFARPESWGGFRLWFDAVELWVEGTDRFHERVRYERELTHHDADGFMAGTWRWQRLQP